jgi:hypothetical protein
MDSTNPDPANIPDDDLGLQNYQDDLDTSSHIHDPLMDDDTDDPTEELGVNRKDFKNELDKYDFGDEDDENYYEREDRREQLEDYDEDVGDESDLGSY